MHKKMLRVSAQVQAAAELAHAPCAPVGAGDAAASATEPSRLLAEARESLWRGQSHDPFWHGVFGGIYLNHLRASNYAALLRAEALCDSLRHGERPFCELELVDFDLDGGVEALVSTRSQNLYIAPVYGGALFEHDLKGVGLNVLDTLARRPEAYHAEIAAARPASDVASAPLAGLGQRAVVKESGLDRLLHYDWYRRLSLLDHFLHPDTRLETFHNVSYGEQGDFVNQAYDLTTQEHPEGMELVLSRDGHVWVGSEFWPLRVRKTVLIPREGAGYRVDYELTNLWERPVDLWFGVEFNFNLRSGAGHRRGYYSATGRHLEPAHPASVAEEEHISEIGLREAELGLDVHLAWDVRGTLWRFPVETVSRSEGGFERVYQSSVVFPNWHFTLDESGVWRCGFEVTVSQQDPLS
jgi:alpha-amylase